MNYDNFFLEVEKFSIPSTILFRSVELKLLKHYLSILNYKQPILDLGCGEGLTAKIVFSRKLDYGLDNDKDFVKLAKKSGIYKQVLFAGARKIPLKGNSVNLVFSNCVIEHIKEIDKVLNEVARILKKSGYFIFTAPSHNFFKYSVFSRLNLPILPELYGRLRNKKFSHYNCLSFLEWKKLLKKYDLTVVDGYYYIDKEIAEFWDFLLFFRFCPEFIRRRIYKYYKDAKTVNFSGAAVCIIAQKI